MSAGTGVEVSSAGWGWCWALKAKGMAQAELYSEEGDGAFWSFKWSHWAGAALRGERPEEDGAKPWRTLSEAGFVLEQATGTQGAHQIASRSLDAFLKPESTWLLSCAWNEVRHQVSDSHSLSSSRGPGQPSAPPTCSLLSHSRSCYFCWGPQPESYLPTFSHPHSPCLQYPTVEDDGSN